MQAMCCWKRRVGAVNSPSSMPLVLHIKRATACCPAVLCTADNLIHKTMFILTRVNDHPALDDMSMYCIRWKCIDTLCPSGYAATAVGGTCTACPPGSFSADGNSTTCTPCAPGTYQPEPGLGYCNQCTTVDVIVSAYQAGGFTKSRMSDATTNKMAPGSGSTSCNITW